MSPEFLLSPPTIMAAAGEDGLGSLWRIELLHPAVVHFSVALTFVGSAFWLLGFGERRWQPLKAFQVAGPVTLVLAAISAWAAVQTGFWADAVVGRELYDPRPLKDHERFGLALAWVLSAVVLVDLGRRTRWVASNLRKWLAFAVAIGLLASCGILGYTAHLGAGLVYQQGAGVQMPGNP